MCEEDIYGVYDPPRPRRVLHSQIVEFQTGRNRMTLRELLAERASTIEKLAGDTSLDAAVCRARVFLLRKLSETCLEFCDVLAAHEIRSLVSRLNYDIQNTDDAYAINLVKLIKDFGVTDGVNLND